MNIKKIKNVLSLFISFILMFSFFNINIKAKEKNFDLIQNDLYEEKLINDCINKYLSGDKNLKIVKDDKGNDKIIVNDKITITNIGNYDYNYTKIEDENTSFRGNITYNGTVTKPAIRLSDGVYAPKDRDASIKFSISGSFSYEISGNIGVSFKLFKAELGASIRETYTQNTTAEYTVKKNKLGTIYGIRVYDEYEYKGWIRKGKLLSPSHFNMFLVER